jgi:hypothetical protein
LVFCERRKPNCKQNHINAHQIVQVSCFHVRFANKIDRFLSIGRADALIEVYSMAAATDSYGTLKLSVYAGRKLTAKDSNGKSDPFVEVTINGSRLQKTPVIKKTLEPSWNHEIRWDNVHKDAKIALKVLDYDAFGANDTIGSIEVTLGQTATTPQWYPITCKKGKSAGEIQLAFNHPAVPNRAAAQPAQQMPQQQQQQPAQQMGYPGAQQPQYQPMTAQPVQMGYPGQAQAPQQPMAAQPVQMGYPGQAQPQQQPMVAQPVQMGYPGQAQQASAPPVNAQPMYAAAAPYGAAQPQAVPMVVGQVPQPGQMNMAQFGGVAAPAPAAPMGYGAPAAYGAPGYGAAPQQPQYGAAPQQPQQPQYGAPAPGSYPGQTR